MVTREKTVVRQAKLRVFAAPNHKSFVLVKRKDAPDLRTRNHVQSNSHSGFVELKFLEVVFAKLIYTTDYRQQSHKQCAEKS